MKLSSLVYILREAGQSLWRNLWMALASVSTVTIALFVLAFFVVVTVNINHVTGLLQNQVEVRVFFKPDLHQAQELALVRDARHWPGIRQIHYFTKAEAANQLKAEFPNQADLLQVITKSNPLFDGMDVYAVQATEIPRIAARFAHNPLVHNVVYQGTVVSRLSRLTAVLRGAGWVLEGLLTIATLLIIVNTIRLAVFARRREVQVMKLVGATDWFIRWPFIVEGLTLGLVGAIVADGLVGAGYRWVINAAAVSLPFWPMAPWHTVMVRTSLFTGLGGIVVGGLASLIALRRFLKI